MQGAQSSRQGRGTSTRLDARVEGEALPPAPDALAHHKVENHDEAEQEVRACLQQRRSGGRCGGGRSA